MKSLTIALKDLSQSFRSAFALIFMFGIPLLVTGMFYFMFGSMQGEQGFQIPATRVVLANLDAGDPRTGNLGAELAKTLGSEQFAGLMEITTTGSAAAARQAVDNGQAGVAIIIPAGFSADFADPTAASEIELYKDPALTTGPAVVESILRQLTGEFAGGKVAAGLAASQGSVDAVMAAYRASAEAAGDPLEVRSPAAAGIQSEIKGPSSMVGSIMAGMLIFFAFFTGVNTAASLLQEDENGTLPRLFTTPTPQAQILGGKFLSVGLTVGVQVITLLVLARLLFGIRWGALPGLALAALAIVCGAAAFGVFVASMLRDPKQGGLVFGSVLTVTGMIGMADVFTRSPGGNPTGLVPLLAPQGWAVRSLLYSMNGEPLAGILPYVLVLLGVSLALFAAGARRFQKRYA